MVGSVHRTLPENKIKENKFILLIKLVTRFKKKKGRPTVREKKKIRKADGNDVSRGDRRRPPSPFPNLENRLISSDGFRRFFYQGGRTAKTRSPPRFPLFRSRKRRKGGRSCGSDSDRPPLGNPPRFFPFLFLVIRLPV